MEIRNFKMTRSGRIAAVAAMALFLFASQRASAVLTVDAFDDAMNPGLLPPTGVNTSGAGGTSGPITETGLLNVIEGRRTTTVNIAAGSGFTFAALDAAPPLGDGVTLNTPDGTAADFIFLYDGIGGLGLGGGAGVDVTDGMTADGFRVDFLSSDAATVTTATLMDVGGMMATATGNTTGGSETLFFNFATDFVGDSVDLNHVKTIEFVVHGVDSGDYHIDLFGFSRPPGEGVPEPATTILLGLAGLAMLRRRRRGA